MTSGKHQSLIIEERKCFLSKTHQTKEGLTNLKLEIGLETDERYRCLMEQRQTEQRH
tara:strand:+ start:419 stop:589 length:171 start_codon:yes stop_codon:yes gene_type:complete